MKEYTLKTKPSTSMDPDLDWSQIRETVRMLNVSVAQIDISLCDGNESVQTLADSFTSIFESVKEIEQQSKALIIGKTNEDVKTFLDDEINKVLTKVESSIMAFQFYDKLSQRLSHIRHALDELAELVGDKHRLYNPIEWTELQNKIRARYSMREEQEMFDVLLNGATIDEAVLKGLEAIKKSNEDKIELF